MKGIILAIIVGAAKALIPGTTELLVNINDSHSVTIQPENFKCLSIYGIETNLRNTVCSWRHPHSYYMEEASKRGFNTFRIPISIQYLVEGNFDILDGIVRKAEEINAQIFLDIHRVSNEYQQPNPDKGIEEYGGVSNRDELFDQVSKMLARYMGSPAVVAVNSWQVELKRENMKYLNRLTPSLFLSLGTR